MSTLYTRCLGCGKVRQSGCEARHGKKGRQAERGWAGQVSTAKDSVTDKMKMEILIVIIIMKKDLFELFNSM